MTYISQYTVGLKLLTDITAFVSRSELQKCIRRLLQSQLAPNDAVRCDFISCSLESRISWLKAPCPAQTQYWFPYLVCDGDSDAVIVNRWTWCSP